MALKEIKPTGGTAGSTAAKERVQSTASRDEQIGFHKGALSTLAKEREEMLKILSIVEQLMQMHVAALKQLGVDLERIAKQSQTAQESPGSKKTPPLERQLK